MLKNTPYINPVRHYRKLASAYVDEQKIQVIVEETDLLITLPSSIDTEFAAQLCHDFVFDLREELKKHIALNPEFFHSLSPIQEPFTKKNSSLVHTMYEAARHAYVGPFAAVAGSIAQMTATMLFLWISHTAEYKETAHNIIVENGGDIYMYSKKNRVVGLLSKPEQKERVGIKIKAEDCPLAFCASSSTIGHSLSFGNGDIAMVMAKNAALADALATSYCNALKSSQDIDFVLERAQKDAHIPSLYNPFSEEEMYTFLRAHTNISCEAKQNVEEKRIDQKRKIKGNKEEKKEGGVLGVFLQCDELIGAWGNIELTLV